jgi:hypothetical protein
MSPAWLRAAAEYVDADPGMTPTERVEWLQRHPEKRLIGGSVPYR